MVNSKKKKVLGIPRRERVPTQNYAQSSAASVPIVGVHEKYQLIETYRGCYEKSYYIGNNNYLTASEDEQTVVYKGWKKVINSLGTDVEAAITIYTHSVNMEDYCEKALYKEVGDAHDEYRKEMNDIILSRLKEGRNGIQVDKFITIAVHAHNVIKAARAFHRIDQDIEKTMSRIGSSAVPVPLEEMLDILYGIYNDAEEHLIQKSRVIDENGKVEEITSFGYEHMRSMGLTVNDVIAPTTFEVNRDYLQMGSKLARTLRVTNVASKMNDEFLTNVSDVNFNCITTVSYTHLTLPTILLV